MSNRIFPAACKASGAGCSQAIEGAHTTFKILAKVRTGQPKLYGGDKFVVSFIEGPALPKCSVVDHYDGTYTVSYTAMQHGAYKLSITADTAHIEGSPFTIRVAPGNAAPALTECMGDGLRGGAAGQQCSFDLTLYDLLKNRKQTGGATVLVQAFRPEDDRVVVSSDAPQPDDHFKLKVVDKNDGSYNVTYCFLTAGQYKLRVLLNGAPIPHSPFAISVAAGPADNMQCTVVGDGLLAGVCGVKGNFVVEARDCYGNCRGRGGETFRVLLIGPEVIEPLMEDTKDGKYHVSYEGKLAGEYQVSVTLGVFMRHHIKDSPFKLFMRPGSACAKNCLAFGNGLSTIIAEKTACFKIQSRDQFGNNRDAGGDLFDVKIFTPALDDRPSVQLPAEVEDHRDGTHSVTYTTNVSGSHNIQVFYAGTPISGSPFTVTSLDSSAGRLSLGGKISFATGLTPTISGDATTFVIRARDHNGHPKHTGGDHFDVSIKGPSGAGVVTANVVDNSDGTYNISYVTTAAGQYCCSVTINGVELESSPVWSFTEPAPVDVRYSLAYGRGLTHSVAGHPARFVLQGRDRFMNNSLTADENYKVSLQGPDHVMTDLVHEGQGAYTCSYVAKKSGNYTVSVMFKDQHFVGSPFNLVVEPAKPDIPSCYPIGDGISAAFPNEPATFKVQSRDYLGNNCAEGGLNFRIAVRGPGTTYCKLIDNGDGTYGATWIPTLTGHFQIEVNIDGEGIMGSPFRATCRERKDKAHPKLTLPKLMHRSYSYAQLNTEDKEKEKKTNEKKSLKSAMTHSHSVKRGIGLH
eukprot:gnl/Hemi2/11171_TR3860_c0_g1_i1.p1 gnl/Hemi2/11171_TR3860_c0_g1~~gnl/Hemi2/11171_TR3860_c0_g1_i1.p1  ORF type:complete len:800 (-),score=268.87 gnl/Hemi2/11171_TR3860_c0_g1_i1:143-2542(-)